MDKNKREQLENILAAINKSIKRIYEEAAAKNQKLPISDGNGKVIYIDPKTVLNK